MKILFFILFNLTINKNYALESNKEVVIQLNKINSNYNYLKTLFPYDSFNSNTKLLSTWKVTFKDSIPYCYLNYLKYSNKIVNFTKNYSLFTRTTIPNDTFFTSQSYHFNKINNGFSIPYGINSIDAWDYRKDITTLNGDTIVVAVCDFGFDINHEDLDFFINHNEIPNDSIDNDNNGATDDYKGWNVARNNSYIYGYGSTHGTPVCGRIAAKGNNNKGVSGVAWNCKLLPIAEVLLLDYALKSFEYIYNMKKLYFNSKGKKGAYIVGVNFSLGKNGKDSGDNIWCEMFDSLGNVGIITTVAVDNKNSDVESYQDMPVLCNSPYMINVTACDAILIGLNGSGFSKKYVHLAAPNTSFSSFPYNSYKNVTPGASFSAPLVAGTIALMYSNFDKFFLDSINKNPKIMSLKIKDIILKNVDVSPNLINQVSSDGKLNVFKTIKHTISYKDSFNQFKNCLNDAVKIINNSTLESEQDSAIYQWYLCSPWRKIANQTSKNFKTNTQGSYSVIISRGSCIDTSNCISLNSNQINISIKTGTSICPNPSKGLVNIKLNKEHTNSNLKIYDLLGRIVYTNNYQYIDKIELNINTFSSGVYTIQLELDDQIETYKLIKEQ